MRLYRWLNNYVAAEVSFTLSFGVWYVIIHENNHVIIVLILNDYILKHRNDCACKSKQSDASAQEEFKLIWDLV